VGIFALFTLGLIDVVIDLGEEKFNNIPFRSFNRIIEVIGT